MKNPLKKHRYKILFLLSGDEHIASSRVRGFWVAEELEKMDFVCTLRWRDTKLALVILSIEVLLQDVIIFQKTYSRYHRWLMAYAKILGKTVYLDIDDAPSKVNNRRTIRNFQSMALTAHGVFVGSRRLYEYVVAFGGNAHFIPTGVALKNYEVIDRSADSNFVCIGWIGNGSHYEKDLVEILKVPLKVLASKYQIRLKVVGAMDSTVIYEGLGKIKGLSTTFVGNLEWQNPHAVMREMNEFDIGVYPLLPNEFNDYKCGFKALEYMAIGIPTVASRNAANIDIISDGVDGFFASTEAEWISELETLIKNTQLRERMGSAGRMKVEADYDIPILAKHMLQIIMEERNS